MRPGAAAAAEQSEPPPKIHLIAFLVLLQGGHKYYSLRTRQQPASHAISCYAPASKATATSAAAKSKEHMLTPQATRERPNSNKYCQGSLASVSIFAFCISKIAAPGWRRRRRQQDHHRRPLLHSTHTSRATFASVSFTNWYLCYESSFLCVRAS